MRTTDSLGARLPNHRIPSDKRTIVTEDDFDGIFEPCNLHGHLYSSYLDAFDLRSPDSLKRDRRARFFNNDTSYWRGRCLGGPLLDRLAPKEREWIGRNKVQAHKNTALADQLLKSVGRYHAIPHTGWEHHQLVNGCVTGSLHLSVLDDGKRFVPPDKIADDMGHVVPFEAGDKFYDTIRYVPDYLFAAFDDHNAAGRYFIVETDLGNEVGKASEPHLRKTLERMVLQILALIGDGVYHQAYRIPANRAMLALIVSTSQAKLDIIERLIIEHTQHTNVPGSNFILTQYLDPDLVDPYKSPKPLDLWTTPWKRAGRSEFYLNNPARQ